MNDAAIVSMLQSGTDLFTEIDNIVPRETPAAQQPTIHVRPIKPSGQTA